MVEFLHDDETVTNAGDSFDIAWMGRVRIDFAPQPANETPYQIPVSRSTIAPNSFDDDLGSEHLTAIGHQ